MNLEDGKNRTPHGWTNYTSCLTSFSKQLFDEILSGVRPPHDVSTALIGQEPSFGQSDSFENVITWYINYLFTMGTCM